MTTRMRVALRAASILLLTGCVVYAHLRINAVSAFFRDERSVRMHFVEEQIRSGWQGSDAQKRTLLDMLDADAAAQEGDTMHLLVITLLYGLLASAAANQLVAIRALWSERPRR